jgi:hypothetical protein
MESVLVTIKSSIEAMGLSTEAMTSSTHVAWAPRHTVAELGRAGPSQRRSAWAELPPRLLGAPVAHGRSSLHGRSSRHASVMGNERPVLIERRESWGSGGREEGGGELEMSGREENKKITH